MKITRKIGILVAVPLAAAIAFAALAVTITVGEVVTADRLRSLVITSAEAGELAQQLRSERSLAVEALILDDTQADDRYAAESVDTDRAIEEYREVREQLTGLPDTTTQLLERIDKHLSQLDGFRLKVSGGEYSTALAAFGYRIIIADLLSYRESVAQAGGAQGEIADQLRGAAALSQAVEHIGVQQVEVTRSLDYGVLTPAAQHTIMSARIGYDEARLNFNAVASDEWRSLFEATQTGMASIDAQEMEDSIARSAPGEELDVDPAAWSAVMVNRADRLIRVQTQVDEDLVEAVTDLRDTRRTVAVVEVAAVVVTSLIAIGIAVKLGRPVVRGLRRLRDAAHQVASEDLPQAVTRLDDHEVLGELTPEQFADSMPAPIDVRGRDELAEVGRAFNEVHREAVRVAAQQALLRLHIAAIFVNLARRGHALSGRLTEALDEAERSELDPERLERLFVLDHLVTLLSRSNDSLLVLGGTSPAKVRTTNEPVADVLTAAQSQIEQYQRVRISPSEIELAVRAHAVDDVVKLLAELLDNAAQYSRDEVVVESYATDEGVVISVVDQGIGIEETSLDRINMRLSTRTPLDLEAVRAMGLTVVGHIAQRLGVQVELRRGYPAGIVAEVTLPMVLLSTELPDKDAPRSPGVAKRSAPLFQAGTATEPTPPPVSKPAPATRPSTHIDHAVSVPLMSFDWSTTEIPTAEITAASAPPARAVEDNAAMNASPIPRQRDDEPDPNRATRRPSPRPRPRPEPAAEPPADTVPPPTPAPDPVAAPATEIGEDGLPRRVPMAQLEPGHLETVTTGPQPQQMRDPAAVGATYAAYARGLASKRSSTLFTPKGSRAES